MKETMNRDNDMETSTNRNFVFISYNHRDVKWAKWLQKKLEWYRLPAEILNDCSDSRYIRPIFRDRDNLTSGVLNDALRRHLEVSKYLVVLCSPNSAQSAWVSEEVKAFIEMGRLEQIVPFIVEGAPQKYGDADIRQALMGECLPLAIRQWNAEHPDKNLLGIAVTDDGEINRDKAFIRLVAFMLGVDFDTLWQRRKRFIRRMVALFACLAVVAAALAYWFMVPVRLQVHVADEPCNLPGMEQGVISFAGSEYSFSHPDTTIALSALPGYNRLHTMPMLFSADRFYCDESIPLHIRAGIRQKVILQLHRDDSFAVYSGSVFDGDQDSYSSHPVEGASVDVGPYHTTTDGSGQFRIEVPLEAQREVLPLKIDKPGYQLFVRDEESPDTDLRYLLHRQ